MNNILHDTKTHIYTCTQVMGDADLDHDEYNKTWTGIIRQ